MTEDSIAASRKRQARASGPGWKTRALDFTTALILGLILGVLAAKRMGCVERTEAEATYLQYQVARFGPEIEENRLANERCLAYFEEARESQP